MAVLGSFLMFGRRHELVERAGHQSTVIVWLTSDQGRMLIGA